MPGTGAVDIETPAEREDFSRMVERMKAQVGEIISNGGVSHLLSGEWSPRRNDAQLNAANGPRS